MLCHQSPKLRAALLLLILGAFGFLLLTGLDRTQARVPFMAERKKQNSQKKREKIVKTEEEWRKILTPEQFYVTRQKGTERAFTGAYNDNHQAGIYYCVSCGQALFDSTTKFDSGTGWPSFYAPIARENVEEETDTTYGMRRVEVKCSRCDAHLGHVFDDGPRPSHLRYCMNSVALKFVPKE